MASCIACINDCSRSAQRRARPSRPLDFPGNPYAGKALSQRCGLDPSSGRFATDTKRITDGTELYLASLRFVDTLLNLYPAFAALNVDSGDVLGGPPPGLPRDWGIELVVLESAYRPMPRTQLIKCVSEGELTDACLRAS